jgi:hypothetical protein
MRIFHGSPAFATGILYCHPEGRAYEMPSALLDMLNAS